MTKGIDNKRLIKALVHDFLVIDKTKSNNAKSASGITIIISTPFGEHRTYFIVFPPLSKPINPKEY